MTTQVGRHGGVAPTDETKPSAGGSMLIGAVGLILLVLIAPSLASAMGSAYGAWGAVILVPVLVALTLPMLARQSARENDR
jgi:hypothetical protein